MNLFIAGSDIACVMISFVLLYAILSAKEKTKKKNRYLILGIVSLIVFSLADAISFFMDEYGGSDLLHFHMNLCSYLGADFILTSFVYYISERIKEKCDFPEWCPRIVLVGSTLDILFLLFGAFSGGLYRIENNKTVYGPLADYIGVMPFIVVAFFLTVIFRRIRQLDKKLVTSIILYFIPPVLLFMIEFTWPQLTVVYLASVISFLFIYVIVVQEDLQASVLGERIMYEASITDTLTGIRNRKAYTEDIENLMYPYPDDFVYLSLDLNGLKNANDTKGHAAGDEIIRGAAQCMTKCLGIYGSVYRTGGDEFTAIVQIPSENLEHVLNDFEEEVASWRGELVDSISISYGYVKADEIGGASIDRVANLADERMYNAKSDFYKKRGVDRRGQVAANTALCNLYTKILKINLTDDTYSIISMDLSEQSKEKGFSSKISEWLSGFGTSGQVHKEDLKDYLEKTNPEYLKSYFNTGKTSISILYRRRYEDGFKQVAMEMIPADDYEETNQTLFLYVRDVDR